MEFWFRFFQWPMGEGVSMSFTFNWDTVCSEVFLTKPFQYRLQCRIAPWNSFALTLFSIATSRSSSRCLRDTERDYTGHGIVSSNVRYFSKAIYFHFAENAIFFRFASRSGSSSFSNISSKYLSRILIITWTSEKEKDPRFSSKKLIKSWTRNTDFIYDNELSRNRDKEIPSDVYIFIYLFLYLWMPQCTRRRSADSHRRWFGTAGGWRSSLC